MKILDEEIAGIFLGSFDLFEIRYVRIGFIVISFLIFSFWEYIWDGPLLALPYKNPLNKFYLS